MGKSDGAGLTVAPPLSLHGAQLFLTYVLVQLIYSGTSLRRTPLGQSHVSILWRVSFIQRFLL